MTTTKWFYPAQKKITDYLNEKFGECYRHEFQNVCRYVVYETYQCWFPKKEGEQQKHERITFVIHKPHNVHNRAIIEVCYSRDEDTLQFFNTKKTREEV